MGGTSQRSVEAPIGPKRRGVRWGELGGIWHLEGWGEVWCCVGWWGRAGWGGVLWRAAARVCVFVARSDQIESPDSA